MFMFVCSPHKRLSFESVSLVGVPGCVLTSWLARSLAAAGRSSCARRRSPTAARAVVALAQGHGPSLLALNSRHPLARAQKPKPEDNKSQFVTSALT
jgi:hypothetical protein